MNRKQRINNLLLEKLKEFSFEIIDNSHLHNGHNEFNGEGETHIKIILCKKKLTNLKSLSVHRKVNELLKNEFDNGLHSLEIKII